MNPLACERLAPECRPAVMCLDSEGRAVFATPEAQRLFDLWNDGLGQAGETIETDLFRLPMVFERIRESAQETLDAGAPSLRLRHPLMPSLAVTVECGRLPLPGAATLCHLLVFDREDMTQEGEGAGRGHRAQALARLTPCERRVALMVSEGMRNGEIADRLHRSRRTIEYQLNTIYRKLDLTCRTQLVRILA